MAGDAGDARGFVGRLAGGGDDLRVQIARHRDHGAGDFVFCAGPLGLLGLIGRRLTRHARVAVFALDSEGLRNVLHVHRLRERCGHACGGDERGEPRVPWREYTPLVDRFVGPSP